MEEKKQKDYDYCIFLTEKQMQIMKRALEIYGRVGIGQLHEITDEIVRHYNGEENISIIDEYVGKLKKLICGLIGRGSNYGIHNPKVPNIFRTSIEMYQSIRYFLACEKEPDIEKRKEKSMSSVIFDNPEKFNNDEMPLLKIEKIETVYRNSILTKILKFHIINYRL